MDNREHSFSCNSQVFAIGSIYSQACCGWIFTNLSFVLPVKRLYETDSLIAFLQPRPSYGLHILMVPKMAIADLFELNQGNQGFLMDLFLCVQKLEHKFSLEECGYRLIVNGGEYQEFPQLHFHLISEKNPGID